MLVAASLPRLVSSSEGVTLAVTAFPLLLLVLFFVGGVGAVVFLVRAVR